MRPSRFRHLVTTPTEPRVCPGCRALTLSGWAEGIRARVDPVALNQPGTLAAILAGRQTYALTRDGLVERDVDHLNHPRGPVLAEHACGTVTPAEHHAIPAATQSGLRNEGSQNREGFLF